MSNLGNLGDLGDLDQRPGESSESHRLRLKRVRKERILRAQADDYKSSTSGAYRWAVFIGRAWPSWKLVGFFRTKQGAKLHANTLAKEWTTARFVIGRVE